jgi:hypothetical protein
MINPLRAILLAGTIALVACTPAQQDELTRDAARTAIRPVLEKNFPGVPLEPATDCVIDNASRSELLSLAADAVTGPTANTVEIVGRIVTRPATITCLAEEGLSGVLLGL